VKNWGESVSELVMGEEKKERKKKRKKERKKKRKKERKKLYTVLSYLGVFTFCTCCKISNLSRVYC